MSWNDHDSSGWLDGKAIPPLGSLKEMDARKKALADAEERVRTRRIDTTPLVTATERASRPTLLEMQTIFQRLAGEAFVRGGADEQADRLRGIANDIRGFLVVFGEPL